MPKKNAKAFITTVPFATVSREPLDLLEQAGIAAIINPLGKNMTHDDFAQFCEDVDYVIAGLPPFSEAFFEKAKKLNLIVRVGVGYDNVPFDLCKQYGVKVSYTPGAGTHAVAELTIGLLIDALRRFSFIDRDLRAGGWNKYMGEMLRGKTVGIIGVGRIGKRVIELLQPFGVRILGNDLVEDAAFARAHNVTFVSKEELYRSADIISIHVSKTPSAHHMISEKALSLMKPSAVLLNLSRGGVVDEHALYKALVQNKIAGAALDVYEEEPYTGPLTALDNVILTAHVGAGTTESRRLMEVGAVEEVVRFHKGEPLQNELDPDSVLAAMK